MVMPFEVTCSIWDLYFILLILRKSLGGKRIYAKEPVRRKILSYIQSCRFDDLQEAVFASIAAKRNEVRLVRNVTLPPRYRGIDRTAQCLIPKNEHVRLSSLGGQKRLRHYHDICPDEDEITLALFVLGDGARLSMQSISLETWSLAANRPTHVAVVGTGSIAGGVELSDDVTADGYANLVTRADLQAVMSRRNLRNLRSRRNIAELLDAKVVEIASLSFHKVASGSCWLAQPCAKCNGEGSIWDKFAGLHYANIRVSCKDCGGLGHAPAFRLLR